jgi:hypothetical protein
MSQYLSILLHQYIIYFIYISVTNASHYSHFTSSFTTCFDHPRPSSGVCHYAKTATCNAVLLNWKLKTHNRPCAPAAIVSLAASIVTMTKIWDYIQMKFAGDRNIASNLLNVNGWWIMNWKGFGRKRPCPNWGTSHAFSWKDWGNHKKKKTSFRVAGVWTGIRTEYLPNTNLECYHDALSSLCVCSWMLD